MAGPSAACSRETLLPPEQDGVPKEDCDPERLEYEMGPLELSRRARWTILAGVWLAKFLVLPFGDCSFNPLYGRLCDAMGRRGANQTALVLHVLGLLGCGLSRNMETLIAARFLAGIGGGGLVTTTQVIISDMYSVRERLGCFETLTDSTTWLDVLGTGLGGALGGLINDWLGWRWAFLIQLPLFRRNAWEALKCVDYAGCLCVLGGVGSFLVFLSLHFNSDIPLSDPLVIVSIGLAIAFAILFIVVEFYVVEEPILPSWLLKKRIPLLVGISNILVPQCNFAVMYFYPLWFQSVQLSSTSEAGAHLFPKAVAGTLGSLFAGWMIKKTGKYKILIIIFGIFPTIAAFLIANLQMDSGAWAQWFNIAPLGFGNAAVLQATTVALLASVEVQHIAVMTGYTQLFRGIGQASSVAISSAMFQTRLLSELRSRIHGPDAENVSHEIRHSAKVVASLPSDLQLSARESYAISLRTVFFYAAVCMFISFVVRLGIPEISLDRRSKPTPHPKSSRQRSRRNPGVCI
ncbi:major facilitator superfamily domain-containing protein [Cantharellus anzutake]|uniref:major facilitator superfamily domain-containing protein n=1 Tax=Cantharellus anzutake TaxID=1750568 RepID=UPI001904AD8B|nr:major facilitator superfamily domain-containing protein [Cantharellus anzutake]KAF8343831.1 major facilitator superfamily domain-containing protein [Cantharellus anzutake]